MRSNRSQKLLLVSAAVILLTISSTSAGEKEVPGSKTRNCCLPTHFQAWIGRFAGMPAGGSENVFEEEFVIEFDLPRNRWAFWMRDYYVTDEYTQVIYSEDHNAGTFSIASFQGCAIVPLEKPRTLIQPCIPDDAEFLETQRIGEGEDSLLVDLWKWDIDHMHKKERTTTRVNAAFFQDNCFPHTEIAWWTAEKFNFTTYVTFLEVNVGDGEDSPFKDLSQYYTCKHGEEIPKSIDARVHAWGESYYFMQRFGATTYDPEVYAETPEAAEETSKNT